MAFVVHKFNGADTYLQRFATGIICSISGVPAFAHWDAARTARLFVSGAVGDDALV